MQAKRKKIIPTLHGEIEMLSVKYNVSRRTIYSILNYESDSQLAVEVRNYMIKTKGRKPTFKDI